MKTGPDQLLDMAREAYDTGMKMMEAFEKEAPSWFARLEQPASRQYQAEMLSWLLYLQESTSRPVDEKAARFINELLGTSYSPGALEELKARLGLHRNHFSVLVPTGLQAAARRDRKNSSVPSAQTWVRLLDRIGECFCLYAGLGPLSQMDQRIYILYLTNWIQDLPAASKSAPVFEEPQASLSPLPSLSGLDVLQPADKKEEPKEDINQESLESLQKQLDALVGLEGVKEDVKSLINLLKIKKLRQDRNLADIDVNLHLVFTGNPGTGKTTVARLLAKMYKAMGLLSKGHLVETDRSRMVKGYVGQTAPAVLEVIRSALGGVLFIDEAYALTWQKDPSDFGYEAVSTLLLEMENNRKDLAVIVAGYPGPMEDFLKSNPGLKSRFNKFFHFEDYTPQQLCQILQSQVKAKGFVLEPEALDLARACFETMYETRNEEFANGRDVRNVFEKAVSAQANRLAGYENISDQDLVTLKVQDLCKAFDKDLCPKDGTPAQTEKSE